MIMSTDKRCKCAFLFFLLLLFSHYECIRARVLKAGGAIDAVLGVAEKHMNLINNLCASAHVDHVKLCDSSLPRRKYRPTHHGMPDKLVLSPKDKLAVNGLPKGPTPGSGPNPPHN
ncbi:hypothetical protein O6H91_04G059600 [Diphasiastrum complanatum]|uniref:Uncharacterized protein n=1 Tax=Diphasiastrum complanatum TaxID=34168 RepID=A0ACC2DXA8_DIPCM|nr:hypothetical protein O6H91_04G059600 [Diphasiastrum complanatum]